VRLGWDEHAAHPLSLYTRATHLPSFLPLPFLHELILPKSPKPQSWKYCQTHAQWQVDVIKSRQVALASSKTQHEEKAKGTQFLRKWCCCSAKEWYCLDINSTHNNYAHLTHLPKEYRWKLAKRLNLNISITKRKGKLWDVMGANYHYNGNHITVYKWIKSMCHTP